MYTVPQENDRLNREGNKKKVKCEGYGNWVLLERPGFEDYSTLRKEKRYLFLPVFIRGNRVGGAEVIKQMFEIVELAKVLDGFPRRQPGFVCEACGNVRFMPCGNCSGSRKVFDEDEGVPKSCLECNENGLIRCPDCGS
uniref:Glutaredoxin domain-containing protein n=1 Tax=Manihot esculenta TaxID=3983 RepID=A0A2C9VHG2_MANES